MEEQRDSVVERIPGSVVRIFMCKSVRCTYIISSGGGMSHATDSFSFGVCLWLWLLGLGRKLQRKKNQVRGGAWAR